MNRVLYKLKRLSGNRNKSLILAGILGASNTTIFLVADIINNILAVANCDSKIITIVKLR